MTSFNQINQVMTNNSNVSGVSSTSRMVSAPKRSRLDQLLLRIKDSFFFDLESVGFNLSVSQDYLEPGSLQASPFAGGQKQRRLGSDCCSNPTILTKRTSNQSNNVLGTYSFLVNSLPQPIVSLIYEFCSELDTIKWFYFLYVGDNFIVPREWMCENLYNLLESSVRRHREVLYELLEIVPRVEEWGVDSRSLSLFDVDMFVRRQHWRDIDYEDYDLFYGNMGYDLVFPYFTVSDTYSNWKPEDYVCVDEVSHLKVQSASTELMRVFQRIDKNWYWVEIDNKIKLLEDVMIWWYNLARSTTALDAAVAYTTFIKSQISTSLSTRILFSFNTTVKLIEKYFTRIENVPVQPQAPQRNININRLRTAMNNFHTCAEFDSWDTPLQSFASNIDNVKRSMMMVTSIRNSPLLRKMKDLVVNVLATKLFENLGYDLSIFDYTKLEQDAIKARRWKGADFIVNVIETLVFIVERFYAAYQGGDVMELFYTGSQYDSTVKELKDIKQYYQCLYNRVDDAKYNGTTFLCMVDSLNQKVEAYLRYFDSKKAGVDKKFLLAIMSELSTMRNDYVSLDFKLGTRKAPFGILVYGDSGIGKSTFLEVLFTHFALRRNLDSTSKCKYFKNPVSKYWDNFKTFMWCIILDDIGFMKPAIAQAGGDKTVMEVINVMNNISYIPDQAALHDKGQHPLKAELVIGTTNTKDLNAFSYFSCPSAAQRRFPYVVSVYVKQEYATLDGMLDNTKIPLNTDDYPDYWTFKIEKVVPQTVHVDFKTTASMVIVEEFNNIRDFIIWYNKVIDEHYLKQIQATNSLDNLHRITLCDVCKLPKSMCLCNANLQAQYDSIIYACIYECLSELYIQFMIWFLCALVRLAPRTITRSLYRQYNRYLNYQLGIVKQNYELYSAKFVEQVKRHLIPDKYLYGILGFLATTLAVYGIFTKFMKDEEEVLERQADFNSGNVPVPQVKEKSNMWYADDYITTHCDLGNQTIGCSQYDRESLIKMISPNLVYAQFTCDGFKPIKARGSCLYSDVYLFNNHLVESDKGDVIIINTLQKEGISSNTSVNFSSCDIFRIPERDLCFVRLRGCVPRKDITSFFLKSYVPMKNNGFYLNRARDGQMNVLNIEAISRKNFSHKDLGNVPIESWSGVVKFGTQDGDCGSLMVMMSPSGPVFCGIHVVGHVTSNLVYAVSVDQKSIDLAKDHFKNPTQAGSVTLSVPSREVNLKPLHYKSEVRFVEEGVAEVYGSLDIPKNNSKSTVENTIMNEYLSEHGYETKYTKPDMRSWRPWHLAFKEMVNPATNFDNQILDDCIMAFKDDILLAGIDLSMLEVYHDFTAVNGAQGVAYVDKMNRTTSMGFPYNKSKKYFLVPIEPQFGLNDVVDFTEEVWKQVREIEAKLRKGIRCNPVFNANLKDEPVTHEKAKDGKTRVFAGMPVAYAIVMRKYTLSVVRLIQNNQHLFECACGISCQSKEWEQLCYHLVEYNVLQAIAGDFRKYDKKMAAKVILCGFRLIHDLCALSGNYDAEDLRVIMTMAYDIAFNWQNFNGTLVQFFGSNPSGHVLTVIINSICNSLYMRYAFVKSTGLPASKFKENVRLMTYGDDNIMTVKDASIGFNHTAIQTVMAECGIDYTMADKESESVPFINLYDTTFLKRSFRYDDDLGHVVAPLDHDSIEKMLMVWNKSKSICPQAQAAAVISSANMEYFWYGKEIFHEKQHLFKDLISALELENFCDSNTLCSYEVLKDRFLGSGTE